MTDKIMSPNERIQAASRILQQVMFEIWQNHPEIRYRPNSGFNNSKFQTLYDIACDVCSKPTSLEKWNKFRMSFVDPAME